MNASVTNLGSVLYSESDDGLEAKWIFDKNGIVEHGTGKAERMSELNPERRFEGVFEIVYFDSKGNSSPKLNLTIQYKAEYYELKWVLGEAITDVGIGIEEGSKLFVSYKNADQCDSTLSPS